MIALPGYHYVKLDLGFLKLACGTGVVERLGASWLREGNTEEEQTVEIDEIQAS